MKVLVALCALAALTHGLKVEVTYEKSATFYPRPPSGPVMKVWSEKNCDMCEIDDCCPAGCCPEQNWYCCPDNIYCAATAADCPFVATKVQLVKMAAKKQCEGTPCPAGCCPEQNWYCCPDNMYCAATAADCPFVATRQYLTKLAAAKRN